MKGMQTKNTEHQKQKNTEHKQNKHKYRWNDNNLLCKVLAFYDRKYMIVKTVFYTTIIKQRKGFILYSFSVWPSVFVSTH